MWILSGILILCAAAYTAHRVAAARRRARLRPHFQAGLEALIDEARRWPGSEYEFVDYDTDRYPEDPRHWRTVTLRPSPVAEWRIQIESKRGVRLEWRSEKGRAHFPGELAWSREPWITDALDRLLAAVKALPPPRTFEEFLKKRQEEFDAYIARVEADRAELAKLREAGGGFPSLDDPLDDMD